MEVVTIIDGTALAEECALGFSQCNGKNPCPFHNDWGPIREIIIGALSTQTLAKLAKK
jgi:DNA-binding IscR family transcriptional regulator